MKVKTFDQLDGHVLANMKLYLHKMGIRSKTRQETIRQVKRHFSGWVWGDTIYVKIVPSRREVLDTLVHEFTHWKRKHLGLYRYRTPRQKFKEEFIATLAAARATGRNPDPKRLMARIVRKYQGFCV